MLYVSAIILYSIRSGILSQWSVLRTGVVFWGFSNSTGESILNSILNSLEAVYLGATLLKTVEPYRQVSDFSCSATLPILARGLHAEVHRTLVLIQVRGTVFNIR